MKADKLPAWITTLTSRMAAVNKREKRVAGA